VSHFSIAAVLKPGKAQAGGAQLAAAASLPAKQQVTVAAAGGAAAGGQRQQQQQVSLSVDARQRVPQPPERLPGGADVAAAAGLPAVRLRAPSSSPQDAGCSSVPLEVEVGSPLQGAGSAVPAQQQQQQQAGQLTAEEHHASGYALRKQGDFEGAVRAYSAALALQPAHFKCLFNRAFSLDKVGCPSG
jgi:tetratricopeptide (TPR) repeat protein